MSPALWRLRGCPQQAAGALVDALTALRTTDDTAALERATRLTQYVHDAELYRSAATIAEDTSAAAWARVAALRTLLWTKAPSQYTSLALMLEAPRCAAGCFSTGTSHYYGGHPFEGPRRYRWPVFGRALPGEYVEQIDDLVTRLANDVSAPQVVRRAAAHVLSMPAETRWLHGR